MDRVTNLQGGAHGGGKFEREPVPIVNTSRYSSTTGITNLLEIAPINLGYWHPDSI